MSEWKEYKLGDLVNVQNGYAFKSSDFCKDGIPIIKIKNIVSPSISLEDTVCFNKPLNKQLENFIVRKKDILISMTGSTVNQINSAVGKIGRYPYNKPALLNQRVGKIFVKNSEVANNDFIYYYLNRFEVQYNLALNASGSANQANISPDQIKQIDISIPDVATQKQIAEILSSLDDKIELNNQINKNLEDLAQALFKRWFIDFEFPNENGNPYKSSGGEMVESELGEIPKGWVVKSIYECAEFINGAAYKDIYFSTEDGSIPIIKIVELKYGITDSTKFSNTNLGEKYKIDSGDILFSWSGSPETSIDTFLWTLGPAWLNQHIFKVVTKTNEDKGYVFFLLKFLKSEFICIAKDKQTTGLGHVTVKDLKRLQTPYPTLTVLERFSKIILPCLNSFQNNLEENNNLKKIRDSLLPKLISGQIKIRQMSEL